MVCFEQTRLRLFAYRASNRGRRHVRRSIYLRNQADKCLRHARSLTDSETQAQLRKLVAEYFQQAVDLEQEQVLTKDAVTVDP